MSAFFFRGRLRLALPWHRCTARTLVFNVLAVAGLHGAVNAMPSDPHRPADPADASTAVPRLVHRSSFLGCRTTGDVSVGSWKDANDTVARIGGWRAHAREAARPQPSSNPAPATSPTQALDAAGPTPGSKQDTPRSAHDAHHAK
jgi:hypothetical protein